MSLQVRVRGALVATDLARLGQTSGLSVFTTLREVVVDDAQIGTGLLQWQFDGTWLNGNNPAAQGGKDRYSNAPGSTATIRDRGTRIIVRGTKAPNHGIASVTVDGGQAVVVDTYAASRADDVLLFDTGTLAEGEHVVTVTVTGTKHASSTDAYIAVDAAVCTSSAEDPEPTPPPPVEPGTGTISVFLLPGKRPSAPDANDGNPFCTPIGANAQLVDAQLQFAGAASNDRLTVDDIKMGMDPGAPLKQLETAYSYGDNYQSATPNYVIPSTTRVHVPPGLSSTGKMNSCGAFLDQDKRRVWQGQTTYLTAGGDPSWVYTLPAPSQGGPIDLYGTSALGSHGGSRLSAAMGTIRAWEWLDDAVPIQHALLINLYAAKYLRGGLQGETTGYRWPAVVADGYWNNSGSAGRYGSLRTPPAGMKMGVLLTLPTAYSFGYLTDPKARRVAEALWGFGGYVGDDTYWDVHAISVESTIGSAWNNRSAAFHSQLQQVFQDLVFVNNNGPTNIGGGGAWRVPAPPALIGA